MCGFRCNVIGNKQTIRLAVGELRSQRVSTLAKVGVRHSHGVGLRHDAEAVQKVVDVVALKQQLDTCQGRDNTGIPSSVFVSARWRGAPHRRGQALGKCGCSPCAKLVANICFVKPKPKCL